MSTKSGATLPDTSSVGEDVDAFGMKMSLLKKNMILKNTWNVVDTHLLPSGILQARETQNTQKHSKLGPFKKVLSVHNAFLKPCDGDLNMEIITMTVPKEGKTTTQRDTHLFRFISVHDREEWMEKARKIMNSIREGGGNPK